MSETFQNIADALSGLQTDVAEENTVIDGALTLIEGIPDLIAVAVSKALQAGATPEQLTAFGELADAIIAKKGQLAAGVASAPTGNVQPGEGVTNPAPLGTPGDPNG